MIDTRKEQEMSDNFLIYMTEDEKVSVDVRFDQEKETVWLSLDQLSMLFDRDKSTISRHIKNIFEENELSRDSVVAKFATTARDGKQYSVDYYNLDVIISVGYRVKSVRGTQFRQWATKRLNEYIRKGFTMDDERLKQGRNRYFKELLQRIRDIRSSERNFYQQVTDIYATATDYDPRSKMTLNFFATVQNKLHYAVHDEFCEPHILSDTKLASEAIHTAAELIYERVDSEKPFVGMTNFKGDYVTKDDVKIAKNYLSELELKRLNLLVSEFLDFAEFQALEEKPMKMQDWITALDNQIVAHQRKILEGKGSISHEQAMQKAEKEYDLFRQKELAGLKSDFYLFLEEASKIEQKNK